MKHIIKVNDIQDAKDNPTRPLIAMDSNGILFAESKATVPEGFVDLGLSSGTLWSTKNIGATNGDTAESWYGNYYAWGEIETKNDYSKSNYKFGASSPFSKYNNSDGKTVLESVDDVTTVTNPALRMPTNEDFEELIAGTTSSWVTDYKGISGLNGLAFTGINGNTMFIPAAGCRIGADVKYVGSSCYLWSSSLFLTNPSNAQYLHFNSDYIYTNIKFRCNGHTVRPVC